MSENLDLARSIYADWERGDRSLAWTDPAIEFGALTGGPELRRWTGREQVVEAMRNIDSVWEDFRREAEEYRELDDELVLVVHRRSGRGTARGIELTEIGGRGAKVLHIRDGKVTRIVGHWDRDHGLADLGLEA
jgi:ketosteroid isomerase-like protein